MKNLHWQNDEDSVGDDLELFQERMMTNPLLPHYRPDEIARFNAQQGPGLIYI